MVTHRDHLPHFSIDADGYAFDRTSEQRDLSLEDYGNAVTYPSFMFRQIDQIQEVDLVMFKAAEWWAHQDLYVVRKM